MSGPSRRAPLTRAGLAIFGCAWLFALAAPAFSSVRSSWPNLTGRWAQLQVTTALVDLPIGGPYESKLETLVMVDVRQEGDRLVLEETVCSIESEGPSSLIETTYPAAFIDAMSGRERTAELALDAGRFVYREPKSYRTSGVELEDPASDDLPNRPDDPRVRDPDGDGRPGLTVEVTGFVTGRVFMIQKGWSELVGHIRSARQIEGRVRWDSDQSVIDATHRFLTHPPVSRPHPDGDRHYFRMARVPTSATCEEVEARAGTLFGR
jgi:hypothetical protein